MLLISLMFIPLATFTMAAHPISMTISIMMTVLALSLSAGTIISSFWPSYILFLIYLGGMLILFSYISSMTPNILFFKIKKMKMLSIIVITATTNYTLMCWPNSMNFINLLSLNKMFSLSMYPLTITLMLFLLVSLLSISTILKMNWSPLKMFN